MRQALAAITYHQGYILIPSSITGLPAADGGNPLGRPRGANRLRPPTSYFYLVDFPSTYRHLRALLHLICMEPSSLDNFLVLPTAQVAVNTASYTPCRGPTPLLPSPGLSSLRFCSSSHHPVSRLSRPDSRQLISLHPSHAAPFLVALFSLSRPRRFSSRRPCLRHPDSHPPAFVVTILIERPDSRLLQSHYPNSCRPEPCRLQPRRLNLVVLTLVVPILVVSLVLPVVFSPLSALVSHHRLPQTSKTPNGITFRRSTTPQ